MIWQPPIHFHRTMRCGTRTSGTSSPHTASHRLVGASGRRVCAGANVIWRVRSKSWINRSSETGKTEVSRKHVSLDAQVAADL
jgi:hypothetical protein